jgi:hypothetical protein
MLCFSFIIPGSSFITGLNAQTTTKRTARTPLDQSKSQKTPSAIKAPSSQQIVRARKAGNLNAGDPCLETAPITLGQTINGNLAAGDCLLDDGTYIDFYSFSATAGQPISISMNSGVFDTYLILFDDAGNSIYENDDTGTVGTNSRVPIDGGVITLPYTGEYFIGANSYDPDTGSYTVSLNTDAACATTAIGYNQTVNGNLATSDCAVNIEGEPFYTDLYTFSGTAGQQISIAMNSSAVDSYLILHTPSGDGSLDDDNSGGGTNARIPTTGTFTLPQTGTYTIEASAFNSFEVGAYTLVLTGPTVTVPTAHELFDYDGDGKADISVFRPSEGNWYIQNSGTANSFNIQHFGISTDLIAPADYDGDGKTDIAVYRPSEGNWYILNSTNNTASTIRFGISSDLPVPADYDGDGKDDIAIFRSGQWWVLKSSNLSAYVVNFGTTNDLPVRGDFTGDGKADIAVYRSGTWFVLRSEDNSFYTNTLGNATDIPVPADYDGDNKTDVAVFRPIQGNWYIVNSSNSTTRITTFGFFVDKPVAADYDGDGKADLAVFRPAEGRWYLQQSTAGFASQVFGVEGDIPTPNAFNR